MKKFIIFIAAVAMVGSFVATAMADVSLYGSARFRSYWADVDPGGTSSNDKDLEWRMGHLSRFGADFKSDKITGKVEIDARAGGAGSTGNIEADSGASRLGNLRLRHLWGQYDFGQGKLMIGQNYPLYDAPVSGINYYSGGFQKIGGIGYDVARTSQIRLTFGDLRIAFLQTDTAVAGYTGVTGEVDVSLPKIEARYDFKFDVGSLNLIAGYQTFDFDGTYDGSAVNDSVDSWVVGARAKFDFGPAYLGLGLTYRQNGEPYGAWNVFASGTHMEAPCVEAGSFQNATALGGVVALGYKVNDTFTVEGSYGKLKAEQDTTLKNEDDAQVFGLMAKITVAPGVFIIPEFIYQDNMDNTIDGVSNDDEGNATVFGVFWMINFK